MDRRQTVNMKEAEHTITTMVEKLQAKVKIDPTLEAICKHFASRQRTRGQVTATSLKQAMSKAGYKFSKSQYIDRLKFLESLHIGRLSRSTTGKVKALKGINWTLQSIGKAALGEANSFKRSNRIAIAASPPSVNKVVSLAKKPNAELFVTMNGKTLDFPVYREISEADLGRLLVSLYGEAAAEVRGAV